MFNNTYSKKRVLVTGHTGFKGSWLCMWLKLIGAEVYGISDQIYPDPSLFSVAKVADHMNSFIEDIRDLPKMKELIEQIKPEFIFHLAAQPIVKDAFENPIHTFTTNIIGTANILETLRLGDFQCNVVIITSDKCYDNVEWVWGYKETDQLGGKDPYSASKGGAELIVKTYYHSYFKKDDRIKITSVRAGNVIGGGDWANARIVPDCYRAWAKNEKVIIRSPDATRPWQHVLEPLSGYLRSGQLLAFPENNNINGQAYNFGPPTDHNYTVLDLLQELAVHWDSDHADILQIQRSDLQESGLLKLNIDKALAEQGWKPTLDFKQTSLFTSDWYKQFYKQIAPEMDRFTVQQINEYIAIAKQKRMAWAIN